MRLAVVPAMLLCAVDLAAQSGQSLLRGERFVNTTLGAPLTADIGPHLAFVRDRKVFAAAKQWEWILEGTSDGAMSSTMELSTAIVVPPPTPSDAECQGRTPDFRDPCYSVDQSERPVLALGVSPLGVRVYFSQRGRARPFLALSGGLALFDRDSPVADARALNFAASYEVGVEIPRGPERSSFIVSWKFQHWSNANTAGQNPGIDANMLQIGLKSRRR